MIKYSRTILTSAYPLSHFYFRTTNSKYEVSYTLSTYPKHASFPLYL